MNWLDILIIIVVGFNVYAGFRKGLIKIILDFVALFVSIYGAIQFTKPVATMFGTHLPLSHSWTTVLAFIVLWIALYVVLYTLGNLLEKVITIALLNPLNHIGGVIFGLAKAFLILLLLLIPLVYFNSPAIENSFLVQKFRPPLNQLIDKFLSQDTPKRSGLAENPLPFKIQSVFEKQSLDRQNIKELLDNVIQIVESDP